jgi:folate-binding protein YgfZ
MTVTTLQAAPRPREYVAVIGADAVSYVERMVSNEVATLELGEAREALLLTPKARIVAPLVVLRRADDDLLLLTEPGLGEVVRDTLLRMRLRSRCEIALEEHRSTILLGAAAADGGIPCADFGVPAVELLDTDAPPGTVPVSQGELERLRIRAGVPRWGAELDERVLPAEAGLETRAISFTKGCYPGQEPVARLHYRGHPNRSLRVLAVEEGLLPERDAPLLLGDKDVGRVTSAAVDAELGIVVLGYVRREVPVGAGLVLGDGRVVRPV